MVLAKLKSAINKDKNPQAKHIVALDIGTEFVKALTGKVTTDENGRQIVEVLGVGRQHQSLSDMYSGAIADISGVVDNCDAALNQAEERSGITARDAVV